MGIGKADSEGATENLSLRGSQWADLAKKHVFVTGLRGSLQARASASDWRSCSWLVIVLISAHSR